MQGDRPKIAFVFPGQGSQVVGMGRALAEEFAVVRALYQRSDQVLGRPLSGLSFDGPAGELNDTGNAQPALLVAGLAHLEALRANFPGEYGAPALAAGHSLGEYTALVAAGALGLEDALLLVEERGKLMREASVDEVSGQRTGMAAVLGLDESAVQEVCLEADVDLANLNAPGQAVISGLVGALERAGAIAQQRGARKVIPLAVSGAFHSRWMRPAAEKLRARMNGVRFNEPGVPVVSNVTARPAAAADMAELLVRQVYSPVRWVESVEWLVEQGVEEFIEVGPGRVLSGLIKRIAPAVNVVSTEELFGDVRR